MKTEFNDKDSKVEEFKKLYDEKDFLDAYAAHTDIRVDNNPKGAIGREDEWELHGDLQLDFLISEGLKPHHHLIDLGCGCGRLARKIVPYLNPGNYAGFDISKNALIYAMKLAEKEGWMERDPAFIVDPHLEMVLVKADFIWAHSVFTHLPEEDINKIIKSVSRILNDNGKFLFTYKKSDAPIRTGLKQFKYPVSFFKAIAASHGLSATAHEKIWPATQRTIMIKRSR